MPSTLLELVSAEKRIAAPAAWSPSGGGKLDLNLPLEIFGLIEEGFTLRAKANERLPDKRAVFQLEYHGVLIPGYKGALERIDWRGSAHNNKGVGPVELRFVEQIGSHYHALRDNLQSDGLTVRRPNLPVARPIYPDYQVFVELLAAVGNHFKISNIDVIGVPEWSVTLL